MFRKIVFFLVFLLAIAWIAFAQQMQLRITTPLNGAKVSERPFVEGTVAETNAIVWVIVHPMETSDFWIQPSVTIRENGRWRVQIYVGRPGTIDTGKKFEIMAVANPQMNLLEGKVLPRWPRSQWSSQVIEVTRR